MSTPDDQTGVAEHLEAALVADDVQEKNFHVRQALQLLGVE